MRILWFTNTPSNAYKEFDYFNYSGGWISSLETLVSETGLYELGICFFYNGKKYQKITKDNVVYYSVPFKYGNAFKRILNRHFARLIDEDSFYFEKTIDDFKPDLIHVFGTEMGYGKILLKKSEKVLFHLQGLMEPYSYVFFPPGLNKYKILKKNNLISIFRGMTIYHDYRAFQKRAERELNTIRSWKYFSGRTTWDKNYIGLINPDAHYFHLEESLRKEFFENEWIQPIDIDRNKEIVIGTTINPYAYKGLDLIYKVMYLMTNYKIIWKIFGIKEDDTLKKIICKFLKIQGKNKNITFFGQLCSEHLIKELKTCHFFVHPSYIDNSPNSVCEAMLLGMPVLSSSVGGIKTLIIDQTTGFLFNPYDKYDLAGLLVNLINNYEKAKQVGLNARQVALKRHSPDQIISELNKIYNFIIHDSD